MCVSGFTALGDERSQVGAHGRWCDPLPPGNTERYETRVRTSSTPLRRACPHLASWGPAGRYESRTPRRLHNGFVVDGDPFARLRLTGGRFDGEGMPVETLVELAAYRELVLGVAKELFRAAHPARQRVPRGFAERLQLRLRTVEDGSAVPVLERVAPAEALLAADDEFTHARDVIEDAVAAVAGGAELSSAFPRDALVLFNRFGQTLRSDEAVELRRGAATSGATYTRDVRKRLVLNQRRSFQEEVEDIGWVSEVDADHMSCLIRLRMGSQGAIPAPLDEVTFAAVKEVLEPKGEGPPVRVSGIGVFDTDQRLIRFDSIHEVSVLEGADELATLERRFDELAALLPGWLDGEGVQLDTAVLRRARRVLAELLTFDVPQPRVFPTPDGGVQAEWNVADHEISVTFEPDGTLYAVSVNLASGQTEEPELPADDAEQIARLLVVS